MRSGFGRRPTGAERAAASPRRRLSGPAPRVLACGAKLRPSDAREPWRSPACRVPGGVDGELPARISTRPSSGPAPGSRLTPQQDAPRARSHGRLGPEAVDRGRAEVDEEDVEPDPEGGSSKTPAETCGCTASVTMRYMRLKQASSSVIRSATAIVVFARWPRRSSSPSGAAAPRRSQGHTHSVKSSTSPKQTPFIGLLAPPGARARELAAGDRRYCPRSGVYTRPLRSPFLGPRAHSSGGERFLDTEEVRGSNPRAPTGVTAGHAPVSSERPPSLVAGWPSFGRLAER